MKTYQEDNITPVIAWWSGGITSAVACKIAIDENPTVRVIMMDTFNEDEDTYRFLSDCAKWYGQPIERIHSHKFDDIVEVWTHYKSLNVAQGAICSAVLKRDVRVYWEKSNDYAGQVFGFEYNAKEKKRAKAMSMNWPKSLPVFPLIEKRITKDSCLSIVKAAGIAVPRAYKMGFHNNNCLNTGCVQGGIGYWQKIRDEFPDKFSAMANREHILTQIKGEPVTMLKDQSKEAKESGRFQVFLMHNRDFPEYKDLSHMSGRPPRPLVDCNGFCGLDDLLDDSERNIATYGELYQPEMF